VLFKATDYGFNYRFNRAIVNGAGSQPENVTRTMDAQDMAFAVMR